MERRNRPEAMDGADLDPALLADDLRNLEVLNRLFGGRDVIRRRVLPLIASSDPKDALTVLDIGSGSGDLCRFIVDACRERGRAVRLLSLDAHPQVQAVARDRCAGRYPEIRFVRGDGRLLPLRSGSVDLVLCTLALHHFAEADAEALLSEMGRVSRRWTVVSDLSRSPLAYVCVWFATRFMANPMTRFDGPVSVQRAFTGSELMGLAERAGWRSPAMFREPWFRMSVVLGRDPA
jgi:ubiquinone/menaquinone biosynthesis C-methylase UbiE